MASIRTGKGALQLKNLTPAKLRRLTTKSVDARLQTARDNSAPGNAFG